MMRMGRRKSSINELAVQKVPSLSEAESVISDYRSKYGQSSTFVSENDHASEDTYSRIRGLVDNHMSTKESFQPTMSQSHKEQVGLVLKDHIIKMALHFLSFK